MQRPLLQLGKTPHCQASNISLGFHYKTLKAPTYPLPPSGVPGLDTRVFSCTPSGTGPSVFAGQEPGGFTAVRPSGRLPVWSPLNFVKSDPENWQWKKPLSSAFFGAVWQYGT